MIHRKTSVPLHPISVLVGPNNGGKSALFEAILNFTMVSRGRLSQAFGPGPFSFRSRRSQGGSPSARISYDVDLAADPAGPRFLTYSISYAQSGSGDPARYQIFDERLTASDGTVFFDRAEPESSPLTSALTYLTDDQTILSAIRRARFLGTYEEVDPLITHVAQEVSRIGKYRLNPQFLSQPSQLPDVSAVEPLPEDERPSVAALSSPTLDYRGEGLATVLYFLAETGSPALDEVVERLRETVDGFAGFEFNAVGSERIGYSVRFDDSRAVVAAANLSDGTLSLIGLSVLLANPSRQHVICIEEPENGLTPKSIRHLYQSMRRVAVPTDGSQGTQILISSHSPHVVCEAWNGDDRDFIYQVKPSAGVAVVRQFSEVIKEQKIHLEKDKFGVRERLNLNVADQVMDGYLS